MSRLCSICHNIPAEVGVGPCLLPHRAGEHTDLLWFDQIHVGHDVLDCQRRPEFPVTNAWIALTDSPPKEFH